MVILKENDKAKAGCEYCNKIVPITFRYKTYKVGKLSVPKVLQGFCDICNRMVALPHQSTFKINKYRKKSRN